jgi:hypothetical protein
MNRLALLPLFIVLVMAPTIQPQTAFDNRRWGPPTQISGASTAKQPFSNELAFPNASSGGPPTYAFNGAYANYNITVSGFAIHGFTYTTTVGYVVNALDLDAMTFSVLYNYGGEFTSFSSTVTASFDAPLPLPAVTSHDLSMLNQGNLPVDMVAPPNLVVEPPISTVTPNLTISVPAGRFIVDEIMFANGDKEWVAANSGLVVQETGSFPGSPLPTGIYGTMKLVSTNIPAGGFDSNYLLYAANGVALVAVLLGIVLSTRMGNRKQLDSR